MMAVMQLTSRLTENTCRMSFEFDWETWTFGLCTAFKDLGLVSLVIGPLHVNFERALW